MDTKKIPLNLYAYWCTCSKCKHHYRFYDALDSERAFGELLLRSTRGDLAYLEASSDQAFNEFFDILEAHETMQDLSMRQKRAIFRDIFPVACDPDPWGNRYQIDAKPPCPQCGNQTHHFLDSERALPETVKLVEAQVLTNQVWYGLTWNEKEQLVATELTAYLKSHAALYEAETHMLSLEYAFMTCLCHCDTSFVLPYNPDLNNMTLFLYKRVNEEAFIYCDLLGDPVFHEFKQLLKANDKTPLFCTGKGDYTQLAVRLFAITCDPSQDGTSWYEKRDFFCTQCKQSLSPFHWVPWDLPKAYAGKKAVKTVAIGTHEAWHRLTKVEKKQHVAAEVLRFMRLREGAWMAGVDYNDRA